MTRGFKTQIVPPLEDHESTFHKMKNKEVRESSSTFEFEKFEHFEKTPRKKGTGYQPETEDDAEDDILSEVEEIADIAYTTMEEYKKWIRDNSLGLVQPEIPNTANFELKEHILAMLKDIPFYRKDHRDAYKRIDELNEIANYFNVPNVPSETMLLCMLPVTFKGAAKQLKELPPASITT